MSEEQLKAFIAKAKDDQSIQEKLKAAKALEDVVVIAKDEGFLISTDELKAQEKLSEEELEGVAGGIVQTEWCTQMFLNLPIGRCGQ